MPDRILFYVSGHGFGHARRVTQVIGALAVAAPHVEVYVRTAAPADLFEPLPARRIEPSSIDAGMAERGPLEIDPEGTLLRLEALLGRADAVLSDEAAAVRRIGPGLIVADIPFLAGDVAAAAGVPCVGLSNFTWDWICDPLLGEDPRYAKRYAPIRARMVDGYAKMAAILQLPFGGVSEAFCRRIPAPLVAAMSTRDPADVLACLGIARTDGRPRVLIALRGGIAPQTLQAAAAGAANFLFLCPHDTPAGLPANVLPFPPKADLDFSDLVAVSDVVVSKLGYGIVSDCIAAGSRLLWPRRTGFREDAVVEARGPRHLQMREIPARDFLAGRWAPFLDNLMTHSPPPDPMPTDGATQCARELADFLIGLPKSQGSP